MHHTVPNSKNWLITDLSSEDDWEFELTTTPTLFGCIFLPCVGEVNGFWNENLTFWGLLLQSHLSSFQERGFNFGGFFRACLKIWYWLWPLWLAPLCRFGLWDSSFSLLVNLITDDDERKIVRIGWIRLAQKFSSPTVQILKWWLLCDVVHQNTRICPPIKCNSQTLEALLTSSIPNLPTKEDPNQSR